MGVSRRLSFNACANDSDICSHSSSSLLASKIKCLRFQSDIFRFGRLDACFGTGAAGVGDRNVFMKLLVLEDGQRGLIHQKKKTSSPAQGPADDLHSGRSGHHLYVGITCMKPLAVAIAAVHIARLSTPPFWGRTARCARAVRKVGHSPPPVGSFLGVGLPQGTIAIVCPCSINPPPSCMYVPLRRGEGDELAVQISHSASQFLGEEKAAIPSFARRHPPL